MKRDKQDQGRADDAELLEVDEEALLAHDLEREDKWEDGKTQQTFFFTKHNQKKKKRKEKEKHRQRVDAEEEVEPEVSKGVPERDEAAQHQH